MPVRVTSQPTSEPLSLAALKARLQIDHDDDDETLASLLVAARQKIESWEWRKHLTQTLTLTIDRFPCGPIYLPYPPLQSVTSIVYVDSQGASQTLGVADYQVDIYSEPGRIFPAYGTVWPSVQCVPNAVTVEYIAGHDDPCDVPQSTLIAISTLVKRTYLATADCEDINAMASDAPDWISAFLNPCHDHRVLDFV